MLLSERDAVYEAVKSTPFESRRRTRADRFQRLLEIRFARLRQFEQHVAMPLHLVASLALNFFLAPALANFGFELLIGPDEFDRPFGHPLFERYVQPKNFLFRLFLRGNVARNCQQQRPIAGRQRSQNHIEWKFAPVLTPGCPFKAVASFP